MVSHVHDFKESNWPFDAAINTATFTTRHVLDGSRPIAEVYHDHDGDWQFMCGTTTATEDAKLVCFGCMVERDLSLVELADLPAGWMAYRQTPDDAWTRTPYDDEQLSH